MTIVRWRELLYRTEREALVQTQIQQKKNMATLNVCLFCLQAKN